MSGVKIDFVDKGVLTAYSDQISSVGYDPVIKLKDTDSYYQFGDRSEYDFAYPLFFNRSKNNRKLKKIIKKRVMGEDWPSGDCTSFPNDLKRGNIICTYCERKTNGLITVFLYKLVIYKRPPLGAKDLKIIQDTQFVYKFRLHSECNQCGLKRTIEQPSSI